MNELRWFLMLFLFGCSGAQEELPESLPTLRPSDGPVGRETLSAVAQLRGLEGWTVMPLAHFSGGERHVVIIWPGINSSGRLVDATTVGVCLESGTTGALVECGRRWTIRDEGTSRAALEAQLEGGSYQLRDRAAGVPLRALGPRISRSVEEFKDAVALGDQGATIAAAAAFSRLLHINHVAFQPTVARLLWMAATHRASLEHQSTERHDGGRATLIMSLRRGGVTLRTLEVTAVPVEQGQDLWVLFSYRET